MAATLTALYTLRHFDKIFGLDSELLYFNCFDLG